MIYMRMSCIEFEAIEITPRLNISYIVHATIHASMPPLEIFLNPNVSDTRIH